MSTSVRIEELEKKFAESPRRFFAPLANEYRKAGDAAKAVEICRAHLGEQPNHMSGQIVLGQALYDSQEFLEAQSAFETALSLDPENLIALRHLGELSRRAGDNRRARAWFSRVLDVDPRNSDIMATVRELDQILEAEASVDALLVSGRRSAVSAETAAVLAAATDGPGAIEADADVAEEDAGTAAAGVLADDAETAEGEEAARPADAADGPALSVEAEAAAMSEAATDVMSAADEIMSATDSEPEATVRSPSPASATAISFEGEWDAAATDAPASDELDAASEASGDSLNVEHIDEVRLDADGPPPSVEEAHWNAEAEAAAVIEQESGADDMAADELLSPETEVLDTAEAVSATDEVEEWQHEAVDSVPATDEVPVADAQPLGVAAGGPAEEAVVDAASSDDGELVDAGESAEVEPEPEWTEEGYALAGELLPRVEAEVLASASDEPVAEDEPEAVFVDEAQLDLSAEEEAAAAEESMAAVSAESEADYESLPVGAEAAADPLDEGAPDADYDEEETWGEVDAAPIEEAVTTTAAAVANESPLRDSPVFVTETMAELYASQGYLEMAAAVYRELSVREPHNTAFSARLQQLERQLGGETAVPETVTVGAASEPQKTARFFFESLTRARLRPRMARPYVSRQRDLRSGHESSARVLESGVPARQAPGELTLDSVFRGGQGGSGARSESRSGGYSFEQFFAGSPGAAGAADSQAAVTRDRRVEDVSELEQFNEWLEGLKRS